MTGLKMLFAFLTMLLGVGICLFNDLYFKVHDIGGVDTDSWDFAGTVAIILGGFWLFLLMFANEDDE